MADLLSVAIVDDEQIIRDGLRKVIPWEEYGFRVTGDFDSAEAALDSDPSVPTDLFIIDVCMPRIDGLSLIRRLKSMRQDSLFLILSGHDSFDYAREAIDLGVIGYLLKPVRLEEMGQMLGRAREMVLRQKNSGGIDRETRRSLDEIAESLERARAIRWSDSVWNAIAPWIASTEGVTTVLLEFYPKIDISVSKARPVNTNEYVRNVIDTLGKRSDQHVAIIPLYGNREVLVILRSESMIQHFVRTIHRVLDSSRKEVPITWAGAIAESSGDGLSPEQLTRLRAALETRWWKGADTIFRHEDRGKYPTYDPSAVEQLMLELPRFAERLARSIVSHETSTALHTIETLVGRIRDAATTDMAALSAVLMALYGLIGRELVNEGIDVSTVRLDVIRDIVRDIGGYTFVSLGTDLNLVFTNAIERSRARSRRPHNRTINLALDVIDNRYSENIGLTDVADTVGVTPSHLSRLFKNVLGRSFREYVTSVRLDEAKRRLHSTNDKIYRIAADVGFREQRYFSEVFRKIVGVTPLHYRNGTDSSHVGDGEDT